jgi:hypothetical protein
MTQEKPLSKVQKLELKLKVARKEESERLSKQRAKEQAAAREAEERKFRLAGMFLLEGATAPGALVNAAGKTLDTWLTKPAERELFGLPPIESK